MKAADFRIGWRLLLQERAYSAVSIIGLAVGFAACFLLLAYVRFCFSYDREVPQAERVYVAKMKFNILDDGGWFQATPLPLLDVAENSGLAEAAAAAFPLHTTLRQGATISNLEVMLASTGLPKVLDLRALEGDLQAALARPDALVLTRSAAQALLGSASGALGKTLVLNGGNYQVAAILPDPPVASSLQYRAMAGMGTRLVPDGMRALVAQAWGEASTYLYMRLALGVDPDAMRRRLQAALDSSPVGTKMAADLRQQLQGRKPIEIALTQLPDLYFDRDLANRPGGTAHGDRALVLGVAAIAVLILVLAATNYVNLATVRAMRRQGEIAMRKMMGAGPGRVAGMFLAESLLVALSATAGGMLLAWLLLPACATLMDRPLGAMMTPGAALAALAIGTATGLLAGLYPAWVALRVRPAHTLTGRGAQETHGTLWLRRSVSVLQMTAAMGLTATTLAVAWQSHFAGRADPGFDPAPLLVLEMPAQMWQGEGPRQLRDALLRLKGVEGVATSPEPVGRIFHGMHGDVRRPGGPTALLQDRAVSPNFFQVHGVKAVAGRLFDPQREQESNFNSVMLNAAAAKALGFATPQEAVGQKLSFQGPEGMVQPTIVGIAPDLRYQSLRERPQPMLYRNSLDAATLTVRYSGDLAELERAADALWRQTMPDRVPAIRRAGSYFAANYADDARLAALLAAASSVAMLLAAFGIYVLAAYNVQRRAREIVLRKLHGAGHGAIARLLGMEFAWLLGGAALLGLPPAAFAIERYLATFVEQAPIGPWPLLAALASALLVALGATVRHTLAALRISPALALRG